MEVEHLSLITTPVILLNGEQEVSQGTGFYFVKKVQEEPEKHVLFLITNHHVLTGYPPQEDKPPKGDNIAFFMHKEKDNPANIKQTRFPLFTKNHKSIWLNSETFPEADIAVIPLPSPLFVDTYISGISEAWTEGNIKIRPTSTVTLIGYPYGYYDKKNCLPIWKTGSIASEPDMDFEGKPLFLVDVSAFPGMSGSPTFAIAHGAYEMTDGPTTVGRVQRFLGIFASMPLIRENKYLEEITSESRPGLILEQSLELGHIWKAKLITEMVNNIDVPKYESEILRNL